MAIKAVVFDVGGILRDLNLPADMIATSDDWGVPKPDPGFLRCVIDASPFEAEEILYVGDRLDNDIRPAVVMGLKTALIRRGPWAVIGPQLKISRSCCC
jgi:FMN phosphatase YigB (HAD superfamily)